MMQTTNITTLINYKINLQKLSLKLGSLQIASPRASTLLACVLFPFNAGLAGEMKDLAG